MPFYDYWCEHNGKTVEVYHSLDKRLTTWKEVCQYAHIPADQTPPDALVTRLVSGVSTMVERFRGIDKEDYGNQLRV